MTAEKSPKGMDPTKRQFAMALDLPFMFVGAVVAGGLFGYLLDRWLGTAPVFLLILGALGFYAGLRELRRQVDDVAGKTNGNSGVEPPKDPPTAG